MTKNHFPWSSSTMLLLPVIILFLLTGCKKDIKSIDELVETKTGVISANGSIPSYYFDWETATYMPSLPNANLVPMPWNSGTSAIDPNIVADYKMVNGWELVWNTFRPDIQLNDPGYSYYFALYNRYRGILRFYLWQQGTPIATNFVNHGLKLYGATNSPLLNYNAQEMANLDANQTQFTQVLNQQLSLSGGTWLVFQYDIAYDPNMAATSFPSFGLEWDAKWVSVSEIRLNGNLSGEIKGTVGFPATNAINFGQLVNKAFSTIYGEVGALNFLTTLGGGSGNYIESVRNIAGGAVKGFLTGMAGGAAPPLPVNLTINANMKLEGSLTTNGGILNKKLVMPGQSNSQTADGLTPIYNAPMGIMTLSAAPIVNVNVGPGYVEFEDPWGGTYTQLQYYGSHLLDNNSFSIIWNPNIINGSATGASIQNLQMQLVKTQTPWDSHTQEGGIVPVSPGGRFELRSAIIAWEGSFQEIEYIGKLEVVAGYTNTNIPLLLSSAVDDNFGLDMGVRIAFDVVPNSGAPSTKMVKTFKARVVKHY